MMIQINMMMMMKKEDDGDNDDDEDGRCSNLELSTEKGVLLHIHFVPGKSAFKPISLISKMSKSNSSMYPYV